MATSTAIPGIEVACEHCGETCADTAITLGDKIFCCQGCKLVYELLNENDLCDYYSLNNKPGLSQRIAVRKDKFAFLDDDKIQQQLLQYRDDDQTHITFYIPHIHCSSCLYLLENLHKLDNGVQSVTVNFGRKEARVVYWHSKTTLRRIAEILTSIGYEPYISLQDMQKKKPRVQRDLIYRLGVAGFCFANIMLMSFPEYFGNYGYNDPRLNQMFRILNVSLSLPVFFYSAGTFYKSAWGGLKTGFLNIDAPIVLAIVVTFTRSMVDVISGTGSGYFDSMTGIVFFMLIGRILQDKTYQGLSFDRDYTSYFPLAITVLKDEKEIPTALPDIKVNDTLLIHDNELIPADGILIKGTALVDYSFVTGESVPVSKAMGEIVYAGGKQLEGNIEILTIKEVAQSYLTSLWNRDELKQNASNKDSFIHLVARNFTWILLAIAVGSGLYWWMHDTARVWPAATSILIVACPCTLLLAASFTNGHILRILSRHKLYLRNAATIERLAGITDIVFDKTGTLTGNKDIPVTWHGAPLTRMQMMSIASIATQSTHPLSKLISAYYHNIPRVPVNGFKTTTGSGVSGYIQQDLVKLGNAAFTGAALDTVQKGSVVYVAINQQPLGYFQIGSQYREGIDSMLQQLKTRYKLSVLSGDNDREADYLQSLMGADATLRFTQQPADKLNYILDLQQQGRKVLMIGDGLNDAGALKQSDVGISLTEDSNNFTPASDGILEANQLTRLLKFIRISKANKRIIVISFIISLIYNVIGLSFAVQGLLSPLTAAILMPANSISMILLSYGLSEWADRH